MAINRWHFEVGISEYDIDQGEEIFLSVTPKLRFGPGIRRDGIFPPSMIDPEKIPELTEAHPFIEGIDIENFLTYDAHQQRAFTWTIYHHLKLFLEKMKDKTGDEWLIVGAQGCGDLTMNEWHVAFRNDELADDEHEFIRLATEGDTREPFHLRTYDCLVKFKDRSVRFERVQFRQQGLEKALVFIDGHDETDNVLFAVSGKPIVLRGSELALSNVVDKFNDIRHIFKVPWVEHPDLKISGKDVKGVWWGERALFKKFNLRRAALNGPILVSLYIDEPVAPGGHGILLDKKRIEDALKKAKYLDTKDTPPRDRGQYRFHPENPDKQIDIFFQRNVYPFSSIGVKQRKETYLFDWNKVQGEEWNQFMKFLSKRLKLDVGENVIITRTKDNKKILVKGSKIPITLHLNEKKNKLIIKLEDEEIAKCIAKVQNGKTNIYLTEEKGVIVCQASGGLSGRVGNTIEGITRNMIDFGACSDAFIVDEGMDVFQLINPACRDEKNQVLKDNGEIKYKYNNEQIIRVVARVMYNLLNTVDKKIRNINANKDFVKEIDKQAKGTGEIEDNIANDLFTVKPKRTQIRSIFIFATKRYSSKSGEEIVLTQKSISQKDAKGKRKQKA